MITSLSENQFAGKVALVTGGAAGIGWASACALAADGAQVAICSRPGKTLDDVGERIRKSGFENITPFAADVSSESDIKTLFAAIGKKYGHLNFLVNNAGIDSFCDLENFSLAEFKRVLDVNVSSIFMAVSEALVLMRKAVDAAIVNVGSVHGHVTTAGRSDYVTSKTALIGATRAMALDLAEYGIRINMVSPGAIETPMLTRAWTEKAPGVDLQILKDRAGKQHPCGRIGQPEDIANSIKFLLSKEASFITGTDLLVDGGIHAKLAISSIWED